MINFKNKKTVVIAGFVLLSLASVYYLLSQSTKTTRPTGPGLNIAGPVDQKLRIESALSENETPIPASLPVYKLNVTAITATTMANMATKLGFSTQPQVFKDVNQGDVYFWYEKEQSLRIAPHQHFVDYRQVSDFPVIPTFPSDQALQSQAETFLKTKFLSADVNIKFLSLRYVNVFEEALGQVEKDKAMLAEVKFIQGIDNYNIVNSTVEIGTIDVKIARGETVVSVYLDALPPVADQEPVPLKSFKELVSSLSESKLESLDNGAIDLITFPISSITGITVNKATLAYYKQNFLQSDLLQPIFVLEGTANLSIGNAVPALLYLPAAKN